jgi:hypothetical protein
MLVVVTDFRLHRLVLVVLPLARPVVRTVVRARRGRARALGLGRGLPRSATGGGLIVTTCRLFLRV